MKYQNIPPHPALKRYVQYFWTIDVDVVSGQKFPIRTFVDDSSGIIFQHNNGRSALLKNGSPIPEILIYGQSTIPTENICVASFSAVGVLFYPHAIKELFGIDSLYLTDQTIHMNEFSEWNLTDEIIDTNNVDKQIQLLTNFLIKKIAAVKKEDVLIKHCIQHVKNSNGILTVRDLQKIYNLSERQLERRFQTVAGVSPRHYIKITRFQEAIRLMKKREFKKFSDIAYALQYNDQSHFIRHMKDLSGLNPKLLQNKLDIRIINLMI
jgi:AraC-like DNA-binding protein